MKQNTVISLTNISKVYKLYSNKSERFKEALSIKGKKYHKSFHALRNINLEIEKGEIIGIVGRNGSGKSTLLKIISGILTQSSGDIKTKGKIVPLLELGSGFHPEYTGYDNIYFYNSFLGYSKEDTDSRLEKILEFADIGDHINQPLKTYSSGMKARLAFAVSVNIDPDILIVDEILSVGDELFRRKSYAVMEQYFKAGKTIIYVSHNLDSINQLCTKAIWLHKGEIVSVGVPKEITKTYQKHMLMGFQKGKEYIQIVKSKNNKSEEPQQKQSQKHKSAQNDDLFLDSLINTQPAINQSDFAGIENINIINQDNRKVNMLISNEKEYCIQYDAIFYKNITGVFFTMAFRTIEGVRIHSFQYPEAGKELTIYEGEKYTIKIPFNCSFHNGVYFINLSIRTICPQKTENPILYRIKDCSPFKVVIDREYKCAGIIDFMLKPNIIKQ